MGLFFKIVFISCWVVPSLFTTMLVIKEKQQKKHKHNLIQTDTLIIKNKKI